ncbi:hypothetical protein CK203_054982 [Vitis vinifera]|uniref:Uncharacterized protein n=1 Tax=Vitis vinifera TaxID=29760 RepID=A0A438GNB9_VITVI|nr:hypothetical protein CK203_054982 [Vitis vinifera]
MWRSLEKQDRGAKQREQSIAFQGAKISHDGIQHAKMHSKVQISKSKISHTTIQGAKIFAPAKHPPSTRVAFRTTQANFRTVRTRCENFAHLNPRCENFRTVRNTLWHTSGISHSSSQFSHRAKQAQSAIGGSTSPPAQDATVPPSKGGTPSQRRYPTRMPPTDPVSPAAKAKRPVSGHLRRGPSSRVLESHPNYLRQSLLLRTLRFLWGSSRDHHQASYDRRAAYKGQPGLQRSILPLKDLRYHMEHLLTPRQFYYPRVVLDFYQSMTTRGVRNPTLIYFTMDGRQGIIGARHIAEALRIPYEPVTQADFREWSSFSQRDMVRILSRGTSTASVLTRRELPSGMLLIDVLLRANIFPLQHKVQRRGAILEALFRISKGYYFGPHHLIMTSLLHFEEKVHQKKLQRADVIPLLCTSGSPSCASTSGSPDVPPPPELHQDEQLPQAQQDEILTNTTPPALAAHTSVHMPEATLLASPIAQLAPPVVPATLAPPPSSEPTVTVSLTEFRGLVHSLQTLSTAQDSLIQQMTTICAHQDQIIATQTQHTTILHQIQQHLSMQTLPGHDRSGPSEPPVPDEGTIPTEQPISDEEIRAEPSHDPTTI